MSNIITIINCYKIQLYKGGVKVDLLLWITIGFIIIGFVILASMKKSMESKVAFIIANTEDERNSSKAKAVIWWICGVFAWGIVSMDLVVRCFDQYF